MNLCDPLERGTAERAPSRGAARPRVRPVRGRVFPWIWAWILAALAASLSGCAAGSRGGRMLRQLRNAEYQCDWTFPDTVRLEEGFFWKRLTPRSPLELRVAFSRYAVGELDGDDALDAAVILVVSTRTDARYRYLAAVVDRQGEPRNVATVLLGDRLEVRDIRLRDGRLLVKVVLHEPGEPVGGLMDRSREQEWACRLRGEDLLRER